MNKMLDVDISFCDIVTNVFGILSIFALLIALSFSSAIQSIQRQSLKPSLPQEEEANFSFPQEIDKKFINLLCYNNRVVRAEIDEVINKLLNKNSKSAHITANSLHIEASIDDYTNDVSVTVSITPTKEFKGENINEVFQKDSKFMKLIKDYSPVEYDFFIFTYPDSFSITYELQQFLKKNKYRVGILIIKNLSDSIRIGWNINGTPLTTY